MNAKSILLGLALGLSLVTASADIVPSLMSYQGRVTDAAGTLIGNATPVNRTVTFRFYTSSTGGTAIYAETQTVTISAGEFSVLIGNGTGVSGSPGPTSPANTPYTSLSDISNSPSTTALYLGVTIDDGNGATADAEIAPRQQLVSGAFALRAKVAESVAAAAVSTSMIADNAVTTNQIHASAVTSAKIADGSIAAADIGNNVITANKLDTNSIGLWTPSGSNVYRNSNIGIGESNPGFPLNFQSIVGDKISLYGNGGNHYGLGVQNSLLQVYTGGSGADVAFGYGSSGAMTETMRIKGNGNVGIGTRNPVHKLHVDGGNALIHSNSNPYLQLTNGGSGASLFGLSAGPGSFSASASANDTVLRSDSKLLLQSGGGNAGLAIDTSNRVGINTTSPTTTLDVLGVISAHEGGADNGYNGIIRTTRPSNVAQHINMTRAGNYVWSMGFNPNSNSFGIGPGASNDSQFSPAFSIDTNQRVRINTGNSSQGQLNVGGALVSVGSRNGSHGYARMFYEDGHIVFEGYNTYLNNGQWRGFSMDGNNDLDWRSDGRLKEDVEDAEPMLDRLLQVDFRRYHWIGSDEKRKEFGVIAQELKPLFPDLVGQGSDGYYTVGYTSFATIACKAIQELKERSDLENEALSQEIETVEARLKDELATKDAKIADLESRLARLEQLLTASK